MPKPKQMPGVKKTKPGAVAGVSKAVAPAPTPTVNPTASPGGLPGTGTNLKPAKRTRRGP